MIRLLFAVGWGFRPTNLYLFDVNLFGFGFGRNLFGLVFAID